jgi:hypothetical protein
MKPTLVSSCAALVIALAASGCTPRLAYHSGQAWQRNECNKIIDVTERERCMSDANTSYEDYKRDTEGGRHQ